jgi:hypothetical protein
LISRDIPARYRERGVCTFCGAVLRKRGVEPCHTTNSDSTGRGPHDMAAAASWRLKVATNQFSRFLSALTVIYSFWAMDVPPQLSGATSAMVSEKVH